MMLTTCKLSAEIATKQRLAVMAKHKQPREVAILKGAHKVHPERYRGDVPKSDMPLGAPPIHLRDGAQTCWFEISSYAPANVLTGADRIMLEIAAGLLSKFRGLDLVEDEQRDFKAVETTQLIGLLARFGMSPADRQKLAIEKQDKGNPFDDF